MKEKTLIEALLFSIKTMSLIFAYLFVVSSIQSILLIYFPQFEFYVYMLFEFSSGTIYLVDHMNQIFYLLICIGFGGFCAHLQILSGCDEIRINYIHYFLFRVCHVLLCLLLYLGFIVIIG